MQVRVCLVAAHSVACLFRFASLVFGTIDPAAAVLLHASACLKQICIALQARCRCVSCRTQLHFCPVSDKGVMDADVLAARAAREAASVQQFHEDTAHLHSLADFSHWLHSTHLCYAVARQHEWGCDSDLAPHVLASY